MSCARTTSLAGWVQALQEHSPVPGGGAAAAAAAGLGLAAAAMAARYTTGKRWADRSEEAAALASTLERQAERVLDLAEEDQRAYEALQETWRSELPEDEVQRRQHAAQQVPATLLKICHAALVDLHAFLPRCNPQIVSDVRVGIHLLAGAARAAWQTLLVNDPDPDLRAEQATLLVEIAAWDRDAGATG
ncbi:MAG: cyclodeaminase/cyclohydrolase family protein [Planctomycetota bacterium]